MFTLLALKALKCKYKYRAFMGGLGVVQLVFAVGYVMDYDNPKLDNAEHSLNLIMQR